MRAASSCSASIPCSHAYAGTTAGSCAGPVTRSAGEAGVGIASERMASIVDDNPQIPHGTPTLTNQVFVAHAGEGFHFSKIAGQGTVLAGFPICNGFGADARGPGQASSLARCKACSVSPFINPNQARCYITKCFDSPKARTV